jgi:hypothetical protein
MTEFIRSDKVWRRIHQLHGQRRIKKGNPIHLCSRPLESVKNHGKRCESLSYLDYFSNKIVKVFDLAIGWLLRCLQVQETSKQ